MLNVRPLPGSSASRICTLACLAQPSRWFDIMTITCPERFIALAGVIVQCAREIRKEIWNDTQARDYPISEAEHRLHLISTRYHNAGVRTVLKIEVLSVGIAQTSIMLLQMVHNVLATGH
jgi:hypothetical protein